MSFLLFMVLFPVPVEQWDLPTRRDLGRCLVAETGWENEEEKVAVAYVLTKRWAAIHERWPKRTFRSVIRAYCSIFKRRTDRAWIRRLPWDDVPGENAEAWKAVRRLVLRFEDGGFADPLPRAMYFGSEADHRRRYITGILKGIVPMRTRFKNRFYRNG